MLKFSTYEKAFEELLENEGLKKKAAKSGISYGTLKKVYNRGMAAWRTGHRPGTTPQQWGMARVNSYIGKGKGTYYGADADLRGAKRKTKKEALDDKDKSTVKDVIKGLKKAVNIHKSQAASLTKDIKDDVQVKEISKGLAKRYVGKAARDVYFKGRSQATKDAISQLGGPDTDYKKSPERKAAMRMRGIDRATNRLAKKEDVNEVSKDTLQKYHKKSQDYMNTAIKSKDPKMMKNVGKRLTGAGRATNRLAKKEDKVSDAERKAMAAFIAKGKMKKLPPGKAAGYHGKSDPGSSMKGMISPADTKQFGTKKKVGSMK